MKFVTQCFFKYVARTIDNTNNVEIIYIAACTFVTPWLRTEFSCKNSSSAQSCPSFFHKLNTARSLGSNFNTNLTLNILQTSGAHGFHSGKACSNLCSSFFSVVCFFVHGCWAGIIKIVALIVGCLLLRAS